MPSFSSSSLERVGAPGGIEQVGGDERVVLERRRRARLLGRRDRLPVVRDERPLAPAHRHRRERLGLADHHVPARVRGEPQRLRAARREQLALRRLLGLRPLGRERGELARRAATGPAGATFTARSLDGARRTARAPPPRPRRAPPRAAAAGRAARTRGRSRGSPSGRARRRGSSPRSMSTGTSVWIVASSLEIRASSAWFVRFSLRFAPEISSIEASTVSRSPNRCSRSRGRLVADPRDARDVVRGVALQAVEVGDQLGRDAVAVDHGLRGRRASSP